MLNDLLGWLTSNVAVCCRDGNAPDDKACPRSRPANDDISFDAILLHDPEPTLKRDAVRHKVLRCHALTVKLCPVWRCWSQPLVQV